MSVIIGAAFGKIVEWTIFMAIKFINRLRRHEPVAPPMPPRGSALHRNP